MNILFFNSEIPCVTTGGVESVTLSLKQIFENNGHNVYGLCKFNSSSLDSENIKDFYVLPEQGSAVSENNVQFAKKLFYAG